MTQLVISLLGPFQATLDGELLHRFESNKERALLAYLAVENGRAHAREALAELFWPDRPSGKAMANLRHALADLRKTIGDAATEPPFLNVTRYSIQLNPEADVAADLTKMAKADEAGDFEDAAVRQAAALYRGPFLDGFALNDCPEFEAWMITVRERTEWMVMRVLGRLVVNCCRQHDFNQAVAWTEKQLALQPWNEEIHQQLIWLLARSGQHSAAQQQFEHCRTMLAAEFDVEPQPATLALIKQVINGSELPAEMPGQTGSEVLLAQKRPDVHISGFPSVRGSLLGREAELDRLDRRLREPACRLLTIVGVGGAGKTRLAIEAAECCAGLYRDGVYFVPLADVERGELLVNAILQALQAPVIGSADPPQQLLRYLTGKEMLLVLDNFEQLVESGAFLSTLIESTPGLDILVTSRERLNLSIEWLLPLEGLEAPDGEPMPAYKRSPSSFAAVQLFIERMRQLQPNLAQDEATVAQIGRICRLLDGLPLAIELAATWTRLLALDEMIYQLTQGIDLLSTTQRDVPTRHRSMRVVFDHSWQLLPIQVRAVLAQLAVFRGSFSQDGAKTVAEASLAYLSMLLDSSWLRKRADGRYDMHELVRQYCEGRLIEESGQPGLPVAEEVYRRHCLFYGVFMERTSQRINFQVEPMADIHAEFGNLQASWRWALAHDQMDIALNVVFSLWFYLDMIGRYRFGLRLMEDYGIQVQTLFSGSKLGSLRHQSAGIVLVWLKHVINNFALELGLIELASASCDARSCILDQLMPDDRVAELSLLSTVIDEQVVFSRGRLQTAICQRQHIARHFDSADMTYTLMGKERGRLFWLADGYGRIAHAAWLRGDYNRSIGYYVESFEHRRAGGEQRFSARMQASVAYLGWILGEYGVAEQLARDGVRACQRLGDRIGVGFAHETLGQAELATGKLQSACTHLQIGLDVGQQSGKLNLTMDPLRWLGHLALIQGDADLAIAYAHEALDTFENLQTVHSNNLSSIALLLGRAALAQQQHEEASAFFLKTMHAKGRAAWEAMDALAGLAEIHAYGGDSVLAVRMFTTVVNAMTTAELTRQHVDRFIEAQDVQVVMSPQASEKRAETRQSFLRLADQLLV